MSIVGISASLGRLASTSADDTCEVVLVVPRSSSNNRSAVCVSLSCAVVSSSLKPFQMARARFGGVDCIMRSSYATSHGIAAAASAAGEADPRSGAMSVLSVHLPRPCARSVDLIGQRRSIARRELSRQVFQARAVPVRAEALRRHQCLAGREPARSPTDSTARRSTCRRHQSAGAGPRRKGATWRNAKSVGTTTINRSRSFAATTGTCSTRSSARSTHWRRAVRTAAAELSAME